MDMYFIHRRLERFKDKHNYLYQAFVIFTVMCWIVIGLGLFFTPIVLTALFGPVWAISFFIVYPLGFALISWIIDCFSF